MEFIKRLKEFLDKEFYENGDIISISYIQKFIDSYENENK